LNEIKIDDLGCQLYELIPYEIQIIEEKISKSLIYIIAE